jgi:polyribonucleotide nucleotidyltransferase
MFQRGETQIVSVCTLGAPGDAQVMESMDEEFEKRYLHHYIFPPYSTGEVKPMRGPSRREIGHGYLAERALNSMIPPKEEFPYTIWVSSQVFGCNGSSSMGSVCGSTLSLMHAGVPIKRPVSGIAMGLVTDGSGNYKILADIQGLEDFAGDMDFKVAGTTEGITALQMDIKVEGLSIELLRDALQKANKARMHVLDEMLKTISAPNPISSRAPMITQVVISPEQIPVLIGKGGETIQKITKECGVSIDIEQSGLVAITAPDQESGNKALEWVKRITYEPKAGDIIEGKVVKIADFGAFVELAPGKDGLLHISEISSERVARVEDVLKVGDLVKVKVMSVDDKGRLSLSKKALGNS